MPQRDSSQKARCSLARWATKARATVPDDCFRGLGPDLRTTALARASGREAAMSRAPRRRPGLIVAPSPPRAPRAQLRTGAEDRVFDGGRSAECAPPGGGVPPRWPPNGAAVLCVGRQEHAPRLRLRACARQSESDTGAVRSSVDDVVSLRGRSRRWLRRLSETQGSGGRPNQARQRSLRRSLGFPPHSHGGTRSRQAWGLRRAREPVQCRYGSNMVVWAR